MACSTALSHPCPPMLLLVDICLYEGGNHIVSWWITHASYSLLHLLTNNSHGVLSHMLDEVESLPSTSRMARNVKGEDTFSRATENDRQIGATSCHNCEVGFGFIRSIKLGDSGSNSSKI